MVVKMKSKQPQLNKENYYDLSTESYMSFSLYKRFKKCEAESMAYLKGEIPNVDETNPALLMGNYLHTYFESEEAHNEFIEDNSNELISSRGKSKGQLKSNYILADKMVKALERQNLFKGVYQGEKEVILTGKMFGMDWKVRIDCLHVPKDENDVAYFCDLKTSRNLHAKFWDSELRQWNPFVTAYGYDLQMAIYQEIIRQNYALKFAPFIFGVSKEDVPEVLGIEFKQEELDDALLDLEQRMPHIINLIKGKVDPKPCEKCDFCKSRQQIKGFVDIDSLLD
ncbi:PD-(D/E)XK nuclease-like domain-containing protein [Pediococcus pentosaceus]|uniref:PD-(D/E)XK nuclease-like domain-containing protein n=1 Tax=Pediococcus pentosaceus TaxID=1255 RepID=UPI001F343B03|nr:PD-(D/E)XK nuclease-like domain-containing protein [Pediococcus pentosaceus]